jgi:hypothetical protein
MRSGPDNVRIVAHKLKRQSWNWYKFVCQNEPTSTKGLPDGDCITIGKRREL